MRAIVTIIKYIIQNNSPFWVPWRLFQAIIFQGQKRLSKTVRIKSLFNGAKIYLFHHSPIASAFVYTAIPDQMEIEKLRDMADQNTIFLDVGANIGAYSLLLKDKVKSAFAFEAHPKTANLCKQNFLLNNMDPENVCCMAISDNDLPKRFTDQGAGDPTNCQSTEEKGTITVPSMTLDHFIHTQGFEYNTSLLLKVDVEGFEHEVLAGAQKSLAQKLFKGIIFENFSLQQEAILAMLRRLGYKTERINKHNTFAYRD